jgi:hypothetical protein
MPRKVAVLFVHGIYNSNLEYHRPMQDQIVAALPKRLREYVDFEPANWAEIVRRHQRDYLDRSTAAGLFADTDYRRLVLQGLGDAAAYQKTRINTNSSYYQIQGEVRGAIDRLDKRGDPDRPLIFIGHSLGCHILSSFAWDTNTVKHFPEERIRAQDDDKLRQFAEYLKSGSPFRRLETLAGFITMGSNMPLFTFTFGPTQIVPITEARFKGNNPAFPGSGLSEDVLAVARWHNYYSRNDLLGYPLKTLNDKYANEKRITDHEVASEGRFWRWLLGLTPVANAYDAHTKYWTCRPVVRGAAKLISDIITAGDPPEPGRVARLRGGRGAKPQVPAPEPAGTAPSGSV